MKKEQLFDQLVQKRYSTENELPKAINKRIFKTEFKSEEYLIILDFTNAKIFRKFRTP